MANNVHWSSGEDSSWMATDRQSIPRRNVSVDDSAKRSVNRALQQIRERAAQSAALRQAQPETDERLAAYKAKKASETRARRDETRKAKAKETQKTERRRKPMMSLKDVVETKKTEVEPTTEVNEEQVVQKAEPVAPAPEPEVSEPEVPEEASTPDEDTAPEPEDVPAAEEPIPEPEPDTEATVPEPEPVAEDPAPEPEPPAAEPPKKKRAISRHIVSKQEVIDNLNHYYQRFGKFPDERRIGELREEEPGQWLAWSTFYRHLGPKKHWGQYLEADTPTESAPEPASAKEAPAEALISVRPEPVAEPTEPAPAPEPREEPAPVETPAPASPSGLKQLPEESFEPEPEPTPVASAAEPIRIRLDLRVDVPGVSKPIALNLDFLTH